VYKNFNTRNLTNKRPLPKGSTERFNLTIQPYRPGLPNDQRSVENLVVFLETMAGSNSITKLRKMPNLPKSIDLTIQRYFDSFGYIYNSLPIGMGLLDNELHYIAVNQRLAEIHGLPIEDHIGRTPMEVIPGINEQIFHGMAKVMATGKPILNHEISGFTSSLPLTQRYWNENWLPVTDKMGNTIAIMITVEEISDRKRLELFLKSYSSELEKRVAARTEELVITNEKLRVSEERFHLVLSNSSVLLCTQDKDLRYTWMLNPRMTENPEEVFGKTDDEFFPPEIAKKLNSIKQMAIDTASSVREEVFISNGRKSVYSDLSIAPAYDSNGEVSGISCIAHDITEKKLAELKLRRSEERFQKAFNLSPLMMSVIRLDNGRIMDVNEACLRRLGFSRDEVITRTALELGIVDSDTIDLLNNIMNKGGSKSPEFSIRDKYGSAITVVTYTEIIEIDDESYILTCTMDITKETQMQKELARLDRLNLVGEMAATIGHEIRNPMTSVRGFLQMFCSNEKYKEDHAFLQLMIDELDRANNIISEFLGMAKNKNVNLKPCNLNIIIHSLYPMLYSDALRRDMNIMLSLNSTPLIFVDENEIRQLIINLSKNGLESMNAGGTLIISSSIINNQVVLSIKDMGSGLPPEIIDNIGTPFLTTKPMGTGLGLAVSYSIASRNNAVIEFDTGPQGTTFNIAFPHCLPID